METVNLSNDAGEKPLYELRPNPALYALEMTKALIPIAIAVIIIAQIKLILRLHRMPTESELRFGLILTLGSLFIVSAAWFV